MENVGPGVLTMSRGKSLEVRRFYEQAMRRLCCVNYFRIGSKIVFQSLNLYNGLLLRKKLKNMHVNRDVYYTI